MYVIRRTESTSVTPGERVERRLRALGGVDSD
jgi:hypothetical protein